MSLALFSVISSQVLGGLEKYTDSSIATTYIPKTVPIIATFGLQQKYSCSLCKTSYSDALLQGAAEAY